MVKRPSGGRAVFYTIDGLGKAVTTPSGYVLWARSVAGLHGLAFAGMPERIEAMIRSARSQDGNIVPHHGGTGNQLSRRARRPHQGRVDRPCTKAGLQA